MNESLQFHTGRPRSGARETLRPPSVSCGLTADEVALSRRLFGANAVSPGRRTGFFRQFLANLNDPIIKILLAALFVNTVFSFSGSRWAESCGIALTVLVSALVTTISERSSGASFEKLYATLGDSRCRVLRSGEEIDCPTSTLVKYDLVVLRPGDTAPADGILVRGSLRADEAPLTGESRPAAKTASPDALAACRTGEYEMRTGDPAVVFRGSHILAGDGVMLVLAVGDATLYGSIAGELSAEENVSPLKNRLSALAKTISRIGYVSAGVVAAVHLADAFWFDAGQNPALALLRLTDARFVLTEAVNALTLAISILVVAVPEGLPMMITVVLSSNMKRMMKANVLVRRLVGIETAGSVDILFTDKTGTLTSGALTVGEVVTPGGRWHTIGSTPGSLGIRLKKSAEANASAANSTEQALNRFAGIRGIRTPPSDRIPFDSERKFSAALADGCVYLRGAAELLLPACVSYADENGLIRPMTPGIRSSIERAIRAETVHAARVILHAEASPDVFPMLRAHAPDENTPLTFVALSVLRDEIRREVPDAIRQCREAGIQVVMITGDNADTAAAVARSCGILREHSGSRNDRESGPILVDGGVLRKLPDEEVTALLPRLAVISRVTPGDKSRLIRLSKAAGHIVGMTGDGINDAPALKAADVGFAMGSGTDVAREAGDIVITDDNFVSITRAVLYGRTIFSSIRKFITYQLTMNLAAVGVSVLGTMCGIENPVTVIQMLWVNMIMDTLGSLAFAGEPPLADSMKEKPVKRSEPILTRAMLFQMLATGGYAILLAMTFLLSPRVRHFFGGGELYHLTLFFALFVFMGIGIALCTRTERIQLFAHLCENRAFAVIMPAVAAIQLLIVYFGGEIFRCVPLRASDLGLCALFALTVIPADTVRKCILRIRREHRRQKSAA